MDKDFARQKVREGSAFVGTYSKEAIANDGSESLLLRAGSDAVHLSLDISVIGKWFLKAYNGSTFTSVGSAPTGSPLGLVNAVIGGSLPKCLITSSPVVNVLGDSIGDYILVDGFTNSMEIVIPPNEDMLIVLTNKSGGAKDLFAMMEFYENLDYPKRAILPTLVLVSLAFADSDENLLPIDPIFDPAVFEYVATVEYWTDGCIITAIASEEGAYIKGDGAFALSVGAKNSFPLAIGKAGFEPIGYKLDVTRKETSVLKTFSVSHGTGEDLVQLITFNPLVFDYAVDVATTVETVEPVGTVDAGHTLTISAEVVLGSVSLVAGVPTSFTFMVEDDLNVKSVGLYTVTVTRAVA